MDRGQYLPRVLEMVVGGADEGQVDRTGSQVRRLLRAPDRFYHPLQASLVGLFSQVFEECRRNLHGVDRALRPDFFREHPGEKTRPRADVGHGLPWMQADRLDDLSPLSEDFSRVRFKSINESTDVEIGVLELLVQFGRGMTLAVLLGQGGDDDPTQRDNTPAHDQNSMTHAAPPGIGMLAAAQSS